MQINKKRHLYSFSSLKNTNSDILTMQLGSLQPCLSLSSPYCLCLQSLRQKLPKRVLKWNNLPHSHKTIHGEAKTSWNANSLHFFFLILYAQPFRW